MISARGLRKVFRARGKEPFEAVKGIDVTVLERVRQVAPNKEGARGSYSIYRIAE